MVKYTKETAQLLSHLAPNHIDSLVKKLRIDDIKILLLDVLPEIKDISQRRALRSLLLEAEKGLYAGDKQSEVIAESLKENRSTSEQLQGIFSDITTIIAIDSCSEETRQHLLEKATNDELLILGRKLKSLLLDEQGKALYTALHAEQLKRGKSTKRKSTLPALQWETETWQNLLKQIRTINAGLQNKPAVEPVRISQPTILQPTILKAKPSLISRIWAAIKNFFSSIIGFLGKAFRKAPSVTATPETFKVELSKEEEAAIESMRQTGAQYINEVTGIAKIGEKRERSQSNLLTGIMARFGMVAASQMVSGTQNKNHGELFSTAESLARPEDSSATIATVYDAIQNVIPEPPENTPNTATASPLKGEHAFSTGGYPELVSAFETEVIEHLINAPGDFSAYGLDFSDAEQAQLQQYYQNKKSSRDLADVLSSVGFLGGYKTDEKEGYIKTVHFKKEHEKYQEALGLAAKALQQACAKLPDGQSLYLETGLECHAMQLVIKKTGNEFQLSTYDSSGALENSQLSNGIFGLIKLSRMSTTAMRRNAYTFSIPQERLISPQGRDYLAYLVKSGTLTGWAETNEELKIQSSSQSERSHMGWLRNLLALRQRAYVYSHYMQKFGSIALPDAPPKFRDELQRPQNTSNCFAKKIQSCEIYELGKSTYKKVRLATMLHQKRELLKDILKPIAGGGTPFLPTEYRSMLQRIEPEYLSPSELYAVSMKLVELKEPASPAAYMSFFEALIEAKTKLTENNTTANRLAIDSIDFKIASHAQSLYNYLKKDARQSEIEALFAPTVHQHWVSGVMPLKINAEGHIDRKALERLTEHAAAEAWKATIQLLNHQIKKLSVKERYIDSANERLAHASYRQAAKTVTVDDLDQANIVTFTSGFGRKDNVKIELRVNGSRKEIDKATFFKLVVNNSDSLTSPKVIGILDYLRNVSPDTERRYAQQVYPQQHKEFTNKIRAHINRSVEALEATLIQLEKNESKLDDLIAHCQNNIHTVTTEILRKTQHSKTNSLEIRNLELRHGLLKQELAELEKLKQSVTVKIQSLKAEAHIEGSAQNKIYNSLLVLEKLAFDDLELQTINAVSHAFIRVQNDLNALDKELHHTVEAFEINDVEAAARDRTYQLNRYRRALVNNYLETNADFHILNELSLGHMGSEMNKNQNMYVQSPEERIEFYKQRKTDFPPGSVWQKIQSLSQRLKTKAQEIADRKVILSTEILAVGTLNSLKSAEEKYQLIDKYSREIGQQDLPQEIKAAWVREMFTIWLAHETPELLHGIQKRNQAEPTAAINQHFHNFIQQKTNIKYAALKGAGYPVDLSSTEITEMGWKPVTDMEIETIQHRRKQVLGTILQKFKSATALKVNAPVVTPSRAQLKEHELKAQHSSTASSKAFAAPDVTFLSPVTQSFAENGTLKFLRENHVPSPLGSSPEQCGHYFQEIKSYLHKLRSHNGIENKGERINAFCHSATATIFSLASAPPSDLVVELMNSIIDQYRNEDGSIQKSFLTLENSERAQILMSLIKLNLAQITIDDQEGTHVSPQFYSTVKQWEQLIIPTDKILSQQISLLKPDGSQPLDLVLLKEVDNALHESPVGLEGLYEGQKGLQTALFDFGREKQVDYELRKIADRLAMRNGHTLQTMQFLDYYSNPEFLTSSAGINSTEGREFFSRALLDAFQHATEQEKRQLLDFLNGMEFGIASDSCVLKTPFAVFIEEMLIRCSNSDPIFFARNNQTAVNSQNVPSTKSFISSLINPSSDGTDKLFGFAKEINLLSLMIEHHLKTPDDNLLDGLFSQLICSKLAYQLLLDQASEDILASLANNFEYSREMKLTEINMNKLHNELISFTKHLEQNQRGTVFSHVIADYIHNQKFDGPGLGKISPTPSDVPGFISLGGNKSLDVLHGVIFVGNNKLGVMPAHIQAHITIQELGLNTLPFKPQNGQFVYVERNEIKASITQLPDGDLIIQRELHLFDGGTEMLQYIPPEKMTSVPIALSKRVNIEHFFMDSKGTLYGYTSDFVPMLKISEQDNKWSGSLVDYSGNKTAIHLAPESHLSLISQLAKVFPQDEMLLVDNNTVYIPAIAQYIIHDSKTDDYFITDNLIPNTPKRILRLAEQGSAYTEHVLSPAEMKKVDSLTTQITALKAQAEAIASSDILSKHQKGLLEKKINESENAIREIRSPEYFVFIADSSQIKLLEEHYEILQDEMQTAYASLKQGGKNREQLALSYEQAKEAYLQDRKKLKQGYASDTHLRTYRPQNNSLEAKDLRSILHIALIPGKAQTFTKLLGKHLPQSSLTASELAELKNIKAKYREKTPLSMDDRLALVMLIGTEIQHHILERNACAIGRKGSWDKSAYNQLLVEYRAEANQIQQLSGQIPLADFNELWRAIQSEFKPDDDLQSLFSKTIIITPTGEKKPVSINTKTSDMPIESLGSRNRVRFKIYQDPKSLMDPKQVELEEQLRGLSESTESVQAQKDGYYYENYGLFDHKAFERLFSVKAEATGLASLTKEQISTLFGLMLKEGWIRPVAGMDKYQIAQHPGEFYSSVKVAGYLTGIGLERNQIKEVADRLEIFLYQTAVSGGTYSIEEPDKAELLESISHKQKDYTLEYLLAMDKIQSLINKSSSVITLAEINSAYLLNDYRKIISYFPESERAQVEIVFNNAMTRLLYYKTELDHLNDIQTTFGLGQDGKALAMLHIRRNYQLDKLLESARYADASTSEKTDAEIEQERKMQRAFLLFESEFGHRCNGRQVEIFRGLLLEDDTNPDKIDSAQARMGFGKTSLLPLVALYKTGEKLVRFIVPKSALETNTADMSTALGVLLASRAVKDDFLRYRIVGDPEPDMGEESPRLKSLQDAKSDLQKRLTAYKRIRDNREVLVQAPSVRNSIECQAKIFLDMLLKITNEPLQQKELMDCISIINEIRSLSTVSIFDELDATQDISTTDVNYTAGEKIPFNSQEIHPLETITQTIKATEEKTTSNLAQVLLDTFKINDPDKHIFNFITSLQVKEPTAVTGDHSTEIYLIRAILTDPAILSLFTEQEPGTNFGGWFQKSSDGSKSYDYSSLSAGSEPGKKPLLISVPYSAAYIPKPQGSRYDNPEVTAITTLLYYLDPRTEISDTPHLEFLIESFREGIGERPFLDSNGQIPAEFQKLFHDIKELAEIEDPLIRNTQRRAYFNTHLDPTKGDKTLQDSFRRMLARTIIQEQIKIDSGKANSNRYEQGTSSDTVIGFSGTAGDTSSHFKENMLDAAADGNITLGIMGRDNCQQTLTLQTTGLTESGEDYTAALVKQLAASFTENTRTLIDVGGLCKTSNRFVARQIALQLKTRESAIRDNGVIFYDDATNTKKVLILDADNQEKILDLTPEMVNESDLKGSYFTYYDQSHSRGADIKQMNSAHAVLTLSFTVTNNDYKQAIMRMRKIIDKGLGQSFSIAVPDPVRDKIIEDLDLSQDHVLSGNDVALWLRQKELQPNFKNVSLLMMELDSVVKNAILQQQAEVTHLLSNTEMTSEHIAAFRECIRELNDISPFISGSLTDLKTKYGTSYGTIKKDEFIKDLKNSFEKRMTLVFDVINRSRETLKLAPVTADQKMPYYDMEMRIIKKREAQLKDEFIIPSTTSNLSEVQSESESQSESQSQSQSESQTQTHSFSEVNNEEVVVTALLRKHDIQFKPSTLSYLLSSESSGDLPLAHTIHHMNHLFNDNDPIKCSPQYTQSQTPDLEQPLPPIRYFLAREEGHPKVILINQDEANLFKESPIAPWSLYDLAKGKDSLVPITGPQIHSLNDPLLKKLLFSSYHYEMKGHDIDSLATSLDGIATREQLHPKLNTEFKATQHVSAGNDTIFELPKWGFHGVTEQHIDLHIEQTRQIFNETHEKKGVTISIGEKEDRAQVFVSAALNKRISGEDRKQESGDIPADHTKLKSIIKQINTSYDGAMTKRKKLRDELRVLKETRKKITDDFDKKISELQSRKDNAITQAKTQIESSFNSLLNSYLNRRKTMEGYLDTNIDYMCASRPAGEKEFGIRAFGRIFIDGLDEAIGYCCQELINDNKRSQLSSVVLENKLTAYITEIFKVTEARYETLTKCKSQHNSLLDEMYAATKSSQPKARGQKTQNTEITLWRRDFGRVIESHFFDLAWEWQDINETDPQKRDKKWNDLVKVLRKVVNDSKQNNISAEDFYKTVQTRVKEFAAANEMDVDELSAEIMTRMSSSLTANPDQQKNIAAVNHDITNIVKKHFLNHLANASDEQKEFFTRLHDMIKKQIDPHEYQLPALLLDYQHPASIAEITKAIKSCFRVQGIHTSVQEIKYYAEATRNALAGRKYIQDILENNYLPVQNRPGAIPARDGFKPWMFAKNYDELTELDNATLDIQKQLDEAKAQKKAQLAELEKQHVVLRGQLAENNAVVAELRVEKSAVNKLLSGVKKVLSIFTNHQVTIEDESPVDFLDSHFALGKIIRDEISATASLTFTPPEFYDVAEDMAHQQEHMHGLNPDEGPAQKSLNNALNIVKHDAALVQDRPNQITSAAQQQHAEQEAEQLAKYNSHRLFQLGKQAGTSVADPSKERKLGGNTP